MINSEDFVGWVDKTNGEMEVGNYPFDKARHHV